MLYSSWGGGSKDIYLNELTAKICDKKVAAGPIESTAVGNILVQMISMRAVKDIDEARALVSQYNDRIAYIYERRCHR